MSLNWTDKDDPDPGVLGEVPGVPRPWRDGSAPFAGVPNRLCGSPEQWLHGCVLPANFVIKMEAGVLFAGEVIYPAPPFPIRLAAGLRTGASVTTRTALVGGLIVGATVNAAPSTISLAAGFVLGGTVRPGIALESALLFGAGTRLGIELEGGLIIGAMVRPGVALAGGLLVGSELTFLPKATRFTLDIFPGYRYSNEPSPRGGDDIAACTVTVFDQYDALFTVYDGTVSITSSDGDAVTSAPDVLSGGVGTFYFTLKTLGFQSIKATDTFTPALNFTNNDLTVIPVLVLTFANTWFDGFYEHGTLTVTFSDYYGTALGIGTDSISASIDGNPAPGLVSSPISAVDGVVVFDFLILVFDTYIFNVQDDDVPGAFNATSAPWYVGS